MELSHLDETGAARMVDISQKDTTERVAVATSKLSMAPETLQVILTDQAKKGNVLAVARCRLLRVSRDSTSKTAPNVHAPIVTSVSTG